MTDSAGVVDVLLLGPIELGTDAGRMPVPGTKLQALLALLALSAPGSVSDDRLIDELWGDAPPSKPGNALQAQVSQLRRVLGTDRVRREGAGYTLSLTPGHVDLLELEQHVREGRDAAVEGRHREAAEHFAAGVALLRGPPLEGLLDHSFAREAATRIEQLSIAAHEGQIDAELASGRHAGVVPSLLKLVREYPLCERFHAQLILALFRCGRQADALRAYQGVREMLADEMGLEPGPELRSLERAVLSHDPALTAPVLLTSRRRPTLPVPLTSFVGRNEALREIAAAAASLRLITLVGPAGVGKTRLVLEMAKNLDVTQEWWFVDLTPVRDSRGVADAVASAVGADDLAPRDAEGKQRSFESRIVERLGDRSVLLVLDNCEHVLEPAAALASELLALCSGVTVVATSREPLGVDGEHQLIVGPLDDDEATELFTARARSVQPRFRADDAGALVELCRHLDGLPLAIELAAARTKTLPVPEIAARLDDRFQLLVAAKRAGGARQRGLRTAIDWSYDILFEDEQRAFRRLAVFSGGATTNAADAVCGPDALDTVARLVDKSLLIADTSGPVARYRMLESLRAYGVDRLADVDELDDALDEHIAWCIELAEAAEQGVRGFDQLEWLERLDAEHDNLRAALASCVERKPVAGLRLVGALLLPWWYRGRGREGRHWAEALLLRAADAPPLIRVKALTWVGLLADFADETDRAGGLEEELALAERRQREALALAEELGDDPAIAWAMCKLTLTLTRRRIAGAKTDGGEIAALTDRTVARFGAAGDEFGSAIVWAVQAIGALTAGDAAGATAAAQQARTHAAATGNRFVAGRAEWVDGLIASANGDPARAYRHIERGLLLLDELGMGTEVTVQAERLVDLAEQLGEHDLAGQWERFVAARGSGFARHDVLVLAAARNRDGLQARLDGDLPRAHAAHSEALAGYAEAGVTRGTAFTESCLGFLASEMADDQAAAAHHLAALDAATDAYEAASLALALEGIATGFDGDDAEWAVFLLGAARRLWVEAGTIETATHRADVEAASARASAKLGAQSNALAFERGAASPTAAVLLAARTRRLPSA